jgi:pilus assembly protein Flp/PilA
MRRILIAVLVPGCDCTEDDRKNLISSGNLASAGRQMRLERITMNDMLLKLYVKFQNLKNGEEGQDLVEYALVVALIAFGATAGMTSLASGINTAFGNVSSQLGTSIS